MVCRQLNDFKYSEWLNNSIRPIDWTQKGAMTPSHRDPQSNDNEGVFLIWCSCNIARCGLCKIYRYVKRTYA